MEQKYWKQFTETGKIEDYLYYRGIEICEQVMDGYRDEENHEPDHSDRHGPIGDTGWGL